MIDDRQNARRRVLKGGRIAFNDGRSTIDCIVRNVSSGGAKLAVASHLGIPDTFALIIGTEPPRPCLVVWRGASELGVAFIIE